MNTMKFNKEMAQAIEDGRKTQTPRPIMPQPKYTRSITQSVLRLDEWHLSGTMGIIKCPYKIGDKLEILVDEKPTGKFIEITDIRVERVQSISRKDIAKEGFTGAKPMYKAKKWFENLWNSIYGKEAWKENKYVWVYDLKKV